MVLSAGDRPEGRAGAARPSQERAEEYPGQAAQRGSNARKFTETLNTPCCIPAKFTDWGGNEQEQFHKAVSGKAAGTTYAASGT